MCFENSASTTEKDSCQKSNLFKYLAIYNAILSAMKEQSDGTDEVSDVTWKIHCWQQKKSWVKNLTQFLNLALYSAILSAKIKGNIFGLG